MIEDVFKKYVLSKFNYQIKMKYEMLPLKKINLCVNNFCNLQCFSCVSLCDKPMGENVWRDQPRTMNPEILDVALKALMEYDKYEAVTFAGGEPTASPIKELKELAFIVRENDLKSIVLTNGYRVNKLDLWDFDYFVLDDHGINEGDIRSSIRYFKEHGFQRYNVISTRLHRDFSKAREKGIVSRGLHCSGWGSLTIWKDLIYPCCSMPQLEGWDNDKVVSDSLFKAGWTVSNPDLVDTLKNWKNTIPGEVLKKCYFSCWRDHKEYEERNIVQNDLLRRMKNDCKGGFNNGN